MAGSKPGAWIERQYQTEAAKCTVWYKVPPWNEACERFALPQRLRPISRPFCYRARKAASRRSACPQKPHHPVGPCRTRAHPLEEGGGCTTKSCQNATEGCSRKRPASSSPTLGPPGPGLGPVLVPGSGTPSSGSWLGPSPGVAAAALPSVATAAAAEGMSTYSASWTYVLLAVESVAVAVTTSGSTTAVWAAVAWVRRRSWLWCWIWWCCCRALWGRLMVDEEENPGTAQPLERAAAAVRRQEEARAGERLCGAGGKERREEGGLRGQGVVGMRVGPVHGSRVLTVPGTCLFETVTANNARPVPLCFALARCSSGHRVHQNE